MNVESFHIVRERDERQGTVLFVEREVESVDCAVCRVDHRIGVVHVPVIPHCRQG